MAVGTAKRKNDSQRKTGVQLRLFDWYARWPQIQAVLHLPRVKESLDIATQNISLSKGQIWDRDKDPVFYSAIPVAGDKPVDRFRSHGFCQAINTWAGVLGEAIAPKLQWRILRALDHSHAVAVGSKHGERTLMMDLVWGPDQSTTVDQQITGAARILADVSCAR